jgi:hypothetical protein
VRRRGAGGGSIHRHLGCSCFDDRDGCSTTLDVVLVVVIVVAVVVAVVVGSGSRGIVGGRRDRGRGLAWRASLLLGGRVVRARRDGRGGGGGCGGGGNLLKIVVVVMC